MPSGPIALIICLLAGIGTAEVVYYFLEETFGLIPECLPEEEPRKKAA